MPKIMITGGAGFIGSHLVAALCEAGHEVVVLDNLSSGNQANLTPLKNKLELVIGDIRHLDLLVEKMAGCEVVFHQAAVVSVTQTVADPMTSAMVNDIGTLNVLEAARTNRVRRVVLASSSAVYGDDPALPKHEKMIPAPMSPYAVQKMTGEYYARIYYTLYGLETVCLRYFNVYGPRQDPGSPYSGVISLFMTKAIKNESPLIYGDGEQYRDFVYVADVVVANLLAAEKPAAAGECFNVADGQTITINRLWREISTITASPVAPRYESPRQGDIYASAASIEKAAAKLGFKPAIGLEEGLKQTCNWYRQYGK